MLTAPYTSLLEMGGQLAGQVTEALRLELETLAHRDQVPGEAIELYLQARHILRTPSARASDAIHLLDRCLIVAPAFPEAVAARAVAIARAYFFGDFGAGDLTAEAPRSIDRALIAAPSLPDTQLAVGLVALHEKRFGLAAQSLVRAVEIAPTHTLALEQLGRLETEAGRGAQGLARLKFAARRDPLRRTCLYPVARSYALRGNLEAFARAMAQAQSIDGRTLIEEIALQNRVAAWTHDRVRAREARRALDSLDNHVAYRIVGLGCELVAGDHVDHEHRSVVEKFLELPLSPRLATVIHQTSCELYGDRDAAYALSHLKRAVELSLIDIEWVELCPALDPLRETTAFENARATVLERIGSMWGSA